MMSLEKWILSIGRRKRVGRARYGSRRKEKKSTVMSAEA